MYESATRGRLREFFSADPFYLPQLVNALLACTYTYQHSTWYCAVQCVGAGVVFRI
jgi:hypothetical protein